MVSEEKFDVAIVGSGQASWNLALPLAAKHFKVVMIEDDIWGGTCPNRGCDPKKLMSQVALTQYQAQLQAGVGVGTVGALDWRALSSFKHHTIDPLTHQLHTMFDTNGITTIKAHGHFSDGQLFADERAIKADKIVLALGQTPIIPDIPGRELIKTSNDFFDFPELPQRLTIIGAGYIAFELASIALIAGSQVTIIHHNQQPLKQFPAELVDELIADLKARGVRFMLDTNVQSVSGDEHQQIAHTDAGEVLSDKIIAATGRQPRVADIGLDAMGIKFNQRGIIVDKYLQTSISNIYAAGDAVNKTVPRITPTAITEGAYLSRLFSGETNEPLVYPLIATAVYAIPRLAMVGQLDGAVTHKEIQLDHLFSSTVTSESGAKALLAFKGQRLVGAAMLSLRADERINELAILIQQRMQLRDLDRIDFIFPSPQTELINFIND